MGGPIGPDLRAIYGTAALAPLQQVTVSTFLRCSGHQETSGSNTAVSALKSGELSRFYLEVAMISCDQKRGGMVKHFSRALRGSTAPRWPRVSGRSPMSMVRYPPTGRALRCHHSSRGRSAKACAT